MILKKTPKKIIRLLQITIDYYYPEKVILFGSFAGGIDTQESDIDICIVKKFSGLRIEEKKKLLRLLWKHDYEYDPEPDFHVYTPSYFETALHNHDPFIEEIVKKGKIVYEKI